MKPFNYVSGMALATALAVAGASHATTIGGGTITFIGTITDNTCSVEGGAGTGGGLDDFSVTMEPVKAFALSAAGATANAKEFEVIVGGPGQGTCQNGKVASMYFLPESPQVDAETGNLKNVLPDEATHVQIQLLKSDRSPINLDQQASGEQTATIENNTATLSYFAQYFATDAATPGLLETNVVYAVDYN
jgi:major type 1 subunit fimbrin (pilin)